MLTNDWSHQSATASNLKEEAIINKATPYQAENRVQKGGEMETIGYTINRNNIRLIFFYERQRLMLLHFATFRNQTQRTTTIQFEKYVSIVSIS